MSPYNEHTSNYFWSQEYSDLKMDFSDTAGNV